MMKSTGLEVRINVHSLTNSVLIRVRPFIDEENNGPKKLRSQCVQFYSVILSDKKNILLSPFIQDNQTVALVRPNYDQKDFFFDSVLDHETEQESAYEQIAYPVVQDVLNGFNGVVMAYGQTGSGKTHTIFGSKASLDALYSKKGADELHYECGIVPRCVNHIFDFIRENPNKAQFRITVSFLEIYMEQITDLLLQQQTSSQTQMAQGGSHNRQSSSHSPIRQGSSQTSLGNQAGSNLKLREDPKTGIFVDGLTQINVKSKEQLHQLIKIGAKRRSVNQTAMNKNSSRSHAVLQVFIEQRWVEIQEGDAQAENGGSPNRNNRKDSANSGGGGQQLKKRHHRKALLTIVDLAGCEKLSKTGSEGMRLQEAKNINKSIAALSNCISALASEKNLNHVPFRDSKLTRLLTESLGGNSKTTICACIGPSLANYEESYSTLLFATRAMSVRTFVKMNEKVEYKLIDEQGRQISAKGTPNAKILLKQNSKLQNETDELRQQVQTLQDQLKKQQSIVSNYTVSNNGGTPNGQQIQQEHYFSNKTNNTSMDAALNQIQGNNQWQKQNDQSRNQFMNFYPNSTIARSQSPQPHSQANNLMMSHQMSNSYGFMGGVNIQNSPIKFNPQMLQQITPQDSQNFNPVESQGGMPVMPSGHQSYAQMNIKQSQQYYQQQQKDSQLILKLSAVVDNLQEEVMAKTIQVQQLQEENLKLKQMQQIQSGNHTFQNNVNSSIESILNNPMMRQILFDKLSKQNFQ